MLFNADVFGFLKQMPQLSLAEGKPDKRRAGTRASNLGKLGRRGKAKTLAEPFADDKIGAFPSVSGWLQYQDLKENFGKPRV